MKDKFDVSHMLSKGWRAEAAKEWSGHEGTREAAAGGTGTCSLRRSRAQTGSGAAPLRPAGDVA